MQYRATKILELLYNDRDTASVSPMISSEVMIQHNDEATVTGRAAFLDGCHELIAQAPDFHLEISEAIVDDRQRKVWVRSEITGLPAGIMKESIDMMTFDEAGVLIRSEDCQRVRRRE